MRIIDALPEHVWQIANLEIECFSSPWPSEVIGRKLTGGSSVMLAALEGDAVLGYIGLMHILDEGYISNIAVSEIHRGKGVACALVNAMKVRGAELGLSFLTLEVRTSNRAARALYTKHGFTEVGRRKGYYEKPTEDALLMTLFL